MCGRYTLTRQEKIVEDLQATLGPEVMGHDWWKPRFNVAPTQPSPVVTLHDGARTIEMMRWGLVPFWATKPGAARPPLMINARKESLHAKQWFREALAQRRCLVPADGFFEWKKDPSDPKHPMPIYLRPESRKIIAFAGLWESAPNPQTSILEDSATIIVGPANERMSRFHDRMPVILDWNEVIPWMAGGVPGAMQTVSPGATEKRSPPRVIMPSPAVT